MRDVLILIVTADAHVTPFWNASEVFAVHAFMDMRSCSTFKPIQNTMSWALWVTDCVACSTFQPLPKYKIMISAMDHIQCASNRLVYSLIVTLVLLVPNVNVQLNPWHHG
ncbi:hypothetical protein K439DRAFT_177399 [Ramaria rubella]|nr:hypothetical protein K439DRAFT_177399 [Ramaria rubella]